MFKTGKFSASRGSFNLEMALLIMLFSLVCVLTLSFIANGIGWQFWKASLQVGGGEFDAGLVVGQDAGTGKVVLTWADAPGNPVYEVQKSSDGGTTWSVLTTVNDNAGTWTDPAVPPASGGDYLYMLVMDVSGDEKPSEVVAVNIPASSITVVATPSGTNSNVVYDTVNGAVSYDVFRKNALTGAETKLTTIVAEASSDYHFTALDMILGVKSAFAAPGGGTYVDNGIGANPGSYLYKVVAKKGDNSTVVSNYSGVIFYTNAAAPAAPTSSNLVTGLVGTTPRAPGINARWFWYSEGTAASRGDMHIHDRSTGEIYNIACPSATKPATNSLMYNMVHGNYAIQAVKDSGGTKDSFRVLKFDSNAKVWNVLVPPVTVVGNQYVREAYVTEDGKLMWSEYDTQSNNRAFYYTADAENFAGTVTTVGNSVNMGTGGTYYVNSNSNGSGGWAYSAGTGFNYTSGEFVPAYSPGYVAANQSWTRLYGWGTGAGEATNFTTPWGNSVTNSVSDVTSAIFDDTYNWVYAKTGKSYGLTGTDYINVVWNRSNGTFKRLTTNPYVNGSDTVVGTPMDASGGWLVYSKNTAFYLKDARKAVNNNDVSDGSLLGGGTTGSITSATGRTGADIFVENGKGVILYYNSTGGSLGIWVTYFDAN